eukprot:10778294-Ditylum_brightwellii.AAC.1
MAEAITTQGTKAATIIMRATISLGITMGKAIIGITEKEEVTTKVTIARTSVSTITTTIASLDSMKRTIMRI